MVDERKYGLKTILAFVLLLALSGVLKNPASGQANVDPDRDTTPVQEVLNKFSDFGAAGNNQALIDSDIRTGAVKDLQFTGPTEVSPTGKITMLLNGRAVAHVLLGNDKTDFYFFFVLEKAKWKIESIRALALPKFITDLRGELRGLPERSDEQEAVFQNLNLTMSSDADLLKWFIDNKADIDRLKELKPVFSHFDDTNRSSARLSNIPEANEIVERLYLNYAEQTSSGRFDISIGGILDNSVGFFMPNLKWFLISHLLNISGLNHSAADGTFTRQPDHETHRRIPCPDYAKFRDPQFGF